MRGGVSCCAPPHAVLWCFCCCALPPLALIHRSIVLNPILLNWPNREPKTSKRTRSRRRAEPPPAAAARRAPRARRPRRARRRLCRRQGAQGLQPRAGPQRQLPVPLPLRLAGGVGRRRGRRVQGVRAAAAAAAAATTTEAAAADDAVAVAVAVGLVARGREQKQKQDEAGRRGTVFKTPPAAESSPLKTVCASKQRNPTHIHIHPTATHQTGRRRAARVGQRDAHADRQGGCPRVWRNPGRRRDARQGGAHGARQRGRGAEHERGARLLGWWPAVAGRGWWWLAGGRAFLITHLARTTPQPPSPRCKKNITTINNTQQQHSPQQQQHHPTATTTTTKQRETKGKVYYEFEFTAKNARYTRHSVAVVTADKGKFYTLTTGANERRWGKMKDRLNTTVRSFTLVNV